MSTPAGWYPDPDEARAGRSGTLRWWNGVAWTDDRTDAPPSLVKSAPEPESRPWGQPAAGPAAPAASWAPQAGAWTPPGEKRAPSGEPLAGLGSRLGARILDSLITGVVATVVAFRWISDMLATSNRFVEDASSDPQSANLFDLYTDPAFTGPALAAGLVFLAVSGLYEVLFLRFRGATPGKAALGLRVRRLRAAAGDPPALTWPVALLRWAVQALPGQLTSIWTLLDSAWCLWDPQRQCLHDKPAATVVVRTR